MGIHATDSVPSLEAQELLEGHSERKPKDTDSIGSQQEEQDSSTVSRLSTLLHQLMFTVKLIYYDNCMSYVTAE